MKNIESIFEFCKDKKRVIIYGDGTIGRIVCQSLLDEGVDVLGFSVTKDVKHEELMGKKVRKIDDYFKEGIDKGTGFVVCMNINSAIEIRELLKSKGVSQVYIVDDSCFWELFDSNRYSRRRLVEVEKSYVSVLMYHRIGCFEYDSFDMSISKEIFEKQIRFLKNNYLIINSNDNWNDVKNDAIVVTFDDGYVDFYENAYPLLKKYDVPATIFVSTGNIGTDQEFWWDVVERMVMECDTLPEQLMINGREENLNGFENRLDLVMFIHEELINITKDNRDKEISSLKIQFNAADIRRKKYRTLNKKEIFELSKDPLITIGAHTVSHIVCNKEMPNVQREEIIDSKKELESIIGTPVNVFAYPNGGFDGTTKEILMENGFKRAFTTELGNVGCQFDSFQIPRNMMRAWDDGRIENALLGIKSAFKVVG